MSWPAYKSKLRLSGTRRMARLSGMDDPTPDPQFDQERQRVQDQEGLAQGIKAVTPQVQEQARAQGVNEPDWGPLEASIPPEYHGGWMWMGYGPGGLRQYKHGLTRRYLHLLPREEMEAHPQYGRYLGDPTLALDPAYGQVVPFRSSYNSQTGHTTMYPDTWDMAFRNAYDGIDQLVPREWQGDPRSFNYDEDYKRQRDQALQDAGWKVVNVDTQGCGPEGCG